MASCRQNDSITACRDTTWLNITSHKDDRVHLAYFSGLPSRHEFTFASTWRREKFALQRLLGLLQPAGYKLAPGFPAFFDPALGQAEHVLTLSTDPSTPPKTYHINITAVGGGNRYACILRVEMGGATDELPILVQLVFLGIMISLKSRRIRCL